MVSDSLTKTVEPSQTQDAKAFEESVFSHGTYLSSAEKRELLRVLYKSIVGNH